MRGCCMLVRALVGCCMLVLANAGVLQVVRAFDGMLHADAGTCRGAACWFGQLMGCCMLMRAQAGILHPGAGTCWHGAAAMVSCWHAAARVSIWLLACCILANAVDPMSGLSYEHLLRLLLVLHMSHCEK
eukprot:jgi/Botrbrau1/10912/Bobra.0025s0085.1